MRIQGNVHTGKVPDRLTQLGCTAPPLSPYRVENRRLNVVGIARIDVDLQHPSEYGRPARSGNWGI